jgi:hypothetical protein
MSSDNFGDPSAGPRSRAFLDALEQYITGGHPITAGEPPDPDLPPTLSFHLQRDIFEAYLRDHGLGTDDGDD